MEILESTGLWFYGSGSDKVYNVELKKVPLENKWEVAYEYGRRGSLLKGGLKTESPVSYSSARSIYNKLIESKKNKGYDISVLRTSSHQRYEMFINFLNELFRKNHVNENEFDTLEAMLASSDPESINMAEVIITTKDQKYGS
jgi:predicted DNA-binding WGR domain protein